MSYEDSILGPDISRYQGPNVDFESFKSANLRFVIVKATHGEHGVDACYDDSIVRAQKAGIEAIGAYHWLTPDGDPAIQARSLYAKTVNRNLTLWPTVDFEDKGFKQLGKKAATKHCEDFVVTLQALTGGPVTVYTGKWFCDEAAEDSQILADCPLHHAQYPSTKRSGNTPLDYAAAIAALPADGPSIASIWASRGKGATLWQFDGDGGLALPQKTDSDFNIFMGRGDEWQAFLAYGSTPRFRERFVPTLLNVQKLLNRSGIDAGKEDGLPGPTTKKAIVALQALHGLQVDGILGPQTIAYLHQLWRSYNPEGV